MIEEMNLKKDTRYALCSCNQSSKYPFCDGVHKKYNMLHGTSYKSIKITPKSDIILTIES